MTQLRLWLSGAFLLWSLIPALAGDITFGSPQQVIPVYNYKNITADATTLVKSGPGVLHGICVNTPTATETSTIYDSLTATGTKIATLTSFTGLPGCYIFDVYFTTGLTVVTAVAAGDITISFY